MNQKNGEDKQVLITQRSLELFLRHGYEETTMRMIQDATGLHSGSIYYVINGKEGILLLISEGFVGDIMCRSSRIARELNDPRLNVLLPPAFILYASTESKCISRLLGQMFRTDSVLWLISSMAGEWASRIESLPNVDLNSALPFVYGGIGSMIGTGMELNKGIRTMLPFLSAIIGNVEQEIVELIEKYVKDEKLPFYDLDITLIDSEFGDEING
ncbi:MAG: helix-turn-helix transcriptional regulator [Thermoplasmata archaeon]|nr:helix-turn-helix transcriptional regulator [Thermoplasmata archaeon]